MDNVRKIWDIVRHREYLGFILGTIVTVAAYELTEAPLAFTFIALAGVFLGFPIVRRLGT